MKKSIIAIASIIALAIPSMAGQSYYYTVQLSTTPSSTGLKSAIGVYTPHINLASVKIKHISITNTGANVQNITFYQNGQSTTTAAATMVYSVPAEQATFEVILPRSNQFSNLDLVNWPYFSAASSTSTTPATINVEYYY